MNANELADEILYRYADSGGSYHYGEEIMAEVEVMLRQQQAEIDSLRKNLDVALMIVNKPKLTDEEITELYNNFYESQFIEFARALLRKAQEK